MSESSLENQDLKWYPRVQEPWLNDVAKLAQEVARREDCYLYDLEFVAGRILRVYIDRVEGAGIEDCSNVSKGLNLALDVDDIVPGGRYHLEVSTPGLDRPLRMPWHFEKIIGKKIWVKLSSPLKDFGVLDQGLLHAKQFEGEVFSVQPELIQMKVKGIDIQIPISGVEKSKVVFEFEKGQKKDLSKELKEKQNNKLNKNKKSEKNEKMHGVQDE